MLASRKKTKWVNGIIVLIAVLILFLADIITKYIFSNKKYFEDFIISIKYSENSGSSFSMFSNISWYNNLIIFISILAIVLIIYFILKIKDKTDTKITKIEIICYILIISGILGNLYDRITYGYVRDFISVKYLFIFNLADLYLTLGAIILLYLEFFKNKKR